MSKQELKIEIKTPNVQENNICNNMFCKRRIQLGQRNPIGVCHKCWEIAAMIQWMSMAGMLSTKDSNADNVSNGGIHIPK
tara:strand:- start:6197 stop:6436 length:240 start_codon:yes stop_codon:yes gene_type:complete